MMELFIETLTGTAFELRVSPFETIMSVKAKIQRLEGIPISQQHLIWQSVELEDDFCLHDYSIHDGATLKLVLAMRGGPINSRRIPMEDPALREMAEYVEANRDEIWEKLPGNRQVTLLVFREGDQLNFFRVVDRGDGTLTPLSESLSGASIYNFNDEDDEEDCPTKEKIEENVRMKEKMKQLRLDMEKLSFNKKPEKEKKVNLPSRSTAYSGHGGRGKLRHLTGTGLQREKTALNKIPRLPPVGQRFTSQLSKEDRASSSETEELNFKSSDEETSSPDHTLTTTEHIDMAKPFVTLAGIQEQSTSLVNHAGHAPIPALGEVDVHTRHSVVSPRKFTRLNSMVEPLSVGSGARHRELTVDNLKETLRPPTSSKTKERKKELSFENLKDAFSRPTTSSHKDTALGSLKETIGRSSSKYGQLDRRKEFTLESLSSSEARAMSGLLRQASLERIGSSRIGNFVTSASKSRVGNYHVSGTGRIPTPDGRIVSGRLRVSASRDGRILSPTHRLPPVKTKKKHVKRCLVCAKKTGLATSYMCRCGNNFCASHRYAESHDCTFDYKTEGRKLLEQSNPVVSAPKLPKI